MTKVIVEVTSSHISNGVALNCRECPIALALNEATGKEWIISGRFMCYRGSYATGFCWSEDIKTPSLVADRLRCYDLSGEMEPFSFELEY